MLAPFVPGTKVRFCFRGHGHSSVPETGYRFADFARDLDAVATAYDATVAIGTSLGAGAIAYLLQDDPGRFDKNVFLLPAGLDLPFQHHDLMLRLASLMEGKTKEEAIATIMDEPERVANYERAPWQREIDLMQLQELNVVGIPRAIREIIYDQPLEDRNVMAKVTAPTLLISRRGDVIHPAEVGEILVDIMPNAELMMFDDGDAMYAAIPFIVAKVNELLLK
jgi:pimeloyl-ACP methyl ester carboxylesterase